MKKVILVGAGIVIGLLVAVAAVYHYLSTAFIM